MDPADGCSICYDLYAEDSSLTRTESHCCSDDAMIQNHMRKRALSIEGCGHVFCHDCMLQHCQHAIDAREIPVGCPELNCEQDLSEEQVKYILMAGPRSTDDDQNPTDSESAQSVSHYLASFQKTTRSQQDLSLVACAKCEELFSKENNSFSSHQNDLKCPLCKHQFCAIHGDMHQGISCQDHRPSTTDQKSERYIQRSTKPCSHCTMPIFKESGCDHIVCSGCRNDMCFKCGSHEYLSGDMLRSCSNCRQSYVDHRHIGRYRTRLLLILPLYVPLAIVYIAISVSIAIVTCGCCCCLGCGSAIEEQSSEKSPKTNANLRPIEATKIVMAIIFLPLVDLLNQFGFLCCCVLDDLVSMESLSASSTKESEESGGCDSIDPIENV